MENLEHGILNGDLTCFSSFKRRPSNRAQSSFPVGNLRYDGVLVIDYGLSPVRAFREFPLVLSSEYTGASMRDAQLQNSAIMLEDFRARMYVNFHCPSRRITDLFRESRPPVIQQRMEGELGLKPLYSIGIITTRVLKTREATMVPTTAYSITDSEESQEGTTQLSGTHSKTFGQSVTKDHDRLVEAENAIMQQNPRLIRSAPPEFLPEDENDARNLLPTSAVEVLALWEALHPTADHFLKLTGREPLRSEDLLVSNYCAQWMDMQNQLRQIWDRTPPAPSLVSRGRWTGGIAKWTSGQTSICV